MSNAKRDDNRTAVGLAWDDTTTQPLKIDPVTGRLLVTIDVVSGTPTVSSRLKRDDNFIPIAAGTGDDGTAAVIPLHINASTGRLAVNLE